MRHKYTLNAPWLHGTGLPFRKMILALSILFLLAAGFCTRAYSQNLGWARRLGGTDYEHGRSVAIDASGNVYTSGEFRGTADFDPGAGTYNLSSFSPCCYDIFISKLDAAGNFIWAKQLGGTGIDLSFSIKVDAAGNVYTTGDFEGTADFDPGPGVNSLTAAGSTDIFVLKLDAAGNFVWVAQMGGPANFAADLDHARSIAVDAAGNVYTTGSFYDVADFDPGAGVYNLTSNYTFQDDVFISKLDANGNFVWAKQIAGTSNEEGVSIAVDATGNVYTTGIFYNTTDFDPGAGIYNLTPPGGNNYDVYISKLDANGNFVWAKQLGGPFITGSSLYDNSYSIAVDAAGNVYTTGYFPGTADFDPGPGVYNMTAAGPNAVDIFISKLDAAGNFVWAKQLGGIYTDVAYAIAVDVSQNVYTTGYFTGQADFDPGPATYNLTPAGGGATADIFVSKLSSSGNFLWAIQMGGTGSEYGLSIAVNASGNVYTAGYFDNTADFDPGPGINNITALGVDDIFIVELINNSLPIKLLNFDAKATDKKTVDITWTTATETNNNYFTVERSKDGRSFQQVAVVNGAINSSVLIHYQATDKMPYAGKSYYRLKQTDADGKYTYSSIVQVQVNTAGSNDFTIYPNPVHNILHLQLNATGNNSAVWQVQDATGKILKQQTEQWYGVNQSINTAGLPTGMYWLVLKKDDGICAKKFIKQ